MDHNARGPGRSGNDPSTSRNDGPQRGGGSVRRARERVEAGVATQDVRPGFSGGEHHQRYPQNTPRSQEPEWPLVSGDDGVRKRNNSPTGERSLGRGSAPQRPPRPSYVPSILDPSQRHGNTPVLQHRQPLGQPSRPQDPVQGNSWDSNYASNRREPGTPGTTGTGFSANSGSLSRPSTSSSVGSIPEFPVPALPYSAPPQQTRRGANLGPPPSSRRGASSYYSQSSYVTPIIEEQYEHGHNNHGSYASSHVIPTSWGDDGSPEFYTPGEEEEDAINEDGRESRSTDHDESSDLVRKASLGKRHKPSLTTIRSTDLDNEEGSAAENATGVKGGSENPSLVSRAAVAAGAAGGAFVTGLGATKEERSGLNHDRDNGRTAFLDTPSSSESSINKNFDNLTAESAAAHSDARAAEDPRVRQILGGLEKGGAIKAGTPSPLPSSPPDQNGKAMKRPNRLNIDTVKEAESRGSLTSLPDLIRRATRLASNLDRGRTASRLVMLDMMGGSDSEKNGSPCKSKFLPPY